jgi:nucleoside-diphosphate-sugar epimerase
VLIVGCGCRGRELGHALLSDGIWVRGTSRTEEGRAAIAATGAEGVVADPLALATLVQALGGVSALVWLMGSASGERRQVSPLNRERLESMLEILVDTPVRGVVYEATGTLPPAHLGEGAAAVRRASETFQMPVRILETPPQNHDAWLSEARAAVAAVLS